MACNFYAIKVKHCTFVVCDWVLRRIPTPQKKLQSNWEGPFQIANIIGSGAYRLREIHGGKLVPRTWNALYLKKNTTCNCFPSLIQSNHSFHIFSIIQILSNQIRQM